MAICGSFSPIPIGGKRLLTIDFAQEIDVGDSIASATAAVVVASTSTMQDGNATQLAIGSATVLGTRVTQMVGGSGVPGVVYALVVTAVMASGEQLIDAGYVTFIPDA